MATNFFSTDGVVMMDMTPNSGHVMCESIDAGITATGSTAAGAAPLVSNINILGTVAASSGVSLPIITAPGATVRVYNSTATVAEVYPPLGGTINGGSINAGVTLAAASGGTYGKGTFLQTAALTYIVA